MAFFDKTVFGAKNVNFYLIVLNLFLLVLAWKVVQKNVSAAYFLGIASSLTSITALVLYDQKIRRRTATLLILIQTLLLIIVYAGIYRGFDIFYNGEVILYETISDNVYFSIVTLTTLGYGDFQPPEPLRLLAGFQAITGYVYLGFIISIVSKYGDRKSGSSNDSI